MSTSPQSVSASVAGFVAAHPSTKVRPVSSMPRPLHNNSASRSVSVGATAECGCVQRQRWHARPPRLSAELPANRAQLPLTQSDVVVGDTGGRRRLRQVRPPNRRGGCATRVHCRDMDMLECARVCLDAAVRVRVCVRLRIGIPVACGSEQSTPLFPGRNADLSCPFFFRSEGIDLLANCFI